jgi:hypothetical protein
MHPRHPVLVIEFGPNIAVEPTGKTLALFARRSPRAFGFESKHQPLGL